MGHYGSAAHLGAIGLGGAIFNFLYWNFAFIRMSAVGLTAQEYGKKNEIEVSTLLGRSMLIAITGAILLIVFREQICQLAFKITKGDPDVEQYAIDYYSIRIWAAPATIGLTALTGWFIGVQDAKTPMFIAILVNVVNIVSSFALVKYTGLKSEAVAWGTLIGQYSGLALALSVILFRYKKYLSLLSFKNITNLSTYKRFFGVNLDIFIRTLAVITVLTWYNFVSAEQGKIILGVNVIFLQLVYAFSFFVDGFANAAEALTGKYFGAGQKQMLKKVIRYLFYWGYGIAIAFTITYLVAWEPIIKIFTTDVEIINASAKYIVWIISIPLISIITFIWDGVFLGTTATAEQRNATIIAAIVFFMVYYLLKNSIGNHALLMAQLVFFGMRGILQSFLYKSAVLNKLNTIAVK